ncbi:aldehyde dehydrogenase family protein [Brucellaceae bacterium VT-16-1752]|nr:aldehyde dehydrogenase family protein [Brucellaceae bacterium VT-16-1752]
MQAKQLIQKTNFYIDGAWQPAKSESIIEVFNPATDAPYAVIASGSATDIDKAVMAARRAFLSWSETALNKRLDYIRKLIAIYEERVDEMADAISNEMGAPIRLAKDAQAAAGLYHTKAFLDVVENYSFEELLSSGLPDQRVIHEPIGVCGLITPWNWPINQIALKVIPALVVGCTVVLKPSEIAPMSALLFAEFIDDACFPKGVFNLVNGDGTTTGEALSNHPQVDMMSFTGSTRAGIAVSRSAAETIKRVSLELGGKSPNIVFADSDLDNAISRGVAHCFENTGQSCNAPTRMLIERKVYDQAVKLAAIAAADTLVDLPSNDGDHIGPVSSNMQFERVQQMIETGIAEGARLIAGGLGRPDGFQVGSFVKPTIFADVNNEMTIARQEIFGPVLVMIPFDTEEEAVRIANDTPYGLAAYIQTGDIKRAKRVARKLRAGMIQINGALRAAGTPFGGCKQSGNGREGGRWGLEEFLEVKLISGY